MQWERRAYLDHAATSPLMPEARRAVTAALESIGNPSSLHADGRRARDLLDEAREAVADRLRCAFAEVVFTSGATESANHALVGLALGSQLGKRRTILASSIEHPCVLQLAPTLRALGFRLETVPVTRNGVADLDAWSDRINEGVLAVAIQHANNELGTFQPVRAIADMAHSAGCAVFVDAVQTLYEPWTVDDLGADLVALSAHKIGGPPGVGALYIRGGTRVNALLRGGSQERERRGGTENVAGIAGFGAAVRALASHGERFRRARREARDAFLRRLSELLPSAWRPTVTAAEVLDGHAHVLFDGAYAERLLIAMDLLGVSASAGSACSAGSLEPSPVLLAIGLDRETAKGGVRFTFGWCSTAEEALWAAERSSEAYSRVVART
ncbi:MAG: cysteine desulfurase [Fimbriimonadales bacterium]|nr:cysteine desulfurase [Fimbriimonadales bacterium]